MKLSKEEKEIEALYERGALKLRKPDKNLIKQLKTAAENTFKKMKKHENKGLFHEKSM